MIEFGQFQIDCNNKQLLHDGQPVALTPKAFAVLFELIQADGNLVTKQTLMDRVWKGTVVTDAALTVCIREIRKTLGESARSPRFITTLHKRGYCFSGNSSKPIRAVTGSGDSSVKTEMQIRVKRKLESGLLSDALSRTSKGQQQIVFIQGEAGLGKTTFVESFVDEHNLDEKRRFTRAQCIEHHGHAEPYQPWLDAFTKLCRKNYDILELFKKHAPMWLLQMPSLLEIKDRDELERRLAGTNSERMMREMLDTLQQLSLNSQLVIYLEDLHFSDMASVQLLSSLARRRDKSNLMIVACYRPTELALKNHPLKILKQELEVRGYSHEIRLTPFSRQQVSDYINKRLPGNLFPAWLAKAIELRSDGNPLFIINVIEYLLNENWINKPQDDWVLSCDEQTVKTCLPENLMQMLGYHIENLQPQIQQMLEAAAVTCNSSTGEIQFSIDQVANAIDEEPEWVEDQCQQLSRSQHFIASKKDTAWIDEEPQTSYTFTHGLYQQAFYQRLTNSKRTALHQKIGNYLESIYHHYEIELDSKLAVHFEQGRDYVKAANYLKKNAEKAAQRGVYSEAKNSLLRAFKLSKRLLNKQQSKQIDLETYISLGPIIIAEKGNTDADVEENYLNAHELCTEVGNTQQMFPIVFGLRSYNLLTGHLSKAHDLSKNLLMIAQELADEDLLLEAHVALASTAFFLGEFRQSLAHANDGISQYRPQRHAYHVKHYALDPGVFCYSRAAQTLWALGYPDQALDQVMQSLNLAKHLEHPYSLAFAHNNYAWVCLYRHEPESTKYHASEAVKLAKEYGFPFYKVWGQIMQGWAITRQGESNKGILLAQASTEEARSMASAIRSYLHTVMADIYLNAAEHDKGLAVLDDINNDAEYFLKSQRYHLRGNLLLKKLQAQIKHSNDDIEIVCQCFRKSVDCAKTQHARSFELRACTSLAQIFIQQGLKGKAHTLLKPVLEGFSEGKKSVDFLNAQALLEECRKTKIISLESIKNTKINTA